MTFELLQSKAVRFAAAVLVAGSLAFAAVAPAYAADAVDGQATTGVYIQADDSKLVASVPTQINVQVNGDGTFITPDASATQIQNGSIFAIHVAEIDTDAVSPFTLGGNGENAVTFTINGIDAATAIDGLAMTDAAWNMAKDGTINLTTAGSIANVTADLSQSQQFMSINWTFEAGSIA